MTFGVCCFETLIKFTVFRFAIFSEIKSGKPHSWNDDGWGHVDDSDVMMCAMVSEITSLMIVYSTVYSDADQRRLQSSASLAFVREFTGDRWIPCTNGQRHGKCFHLMTSSWLVLLYTMQIISLTWRSDVAAIIHIYLAPNDTCKRNIYMQTHLSITTHQILRLNMCSFAKSPQRNRNIKLPIRVKLQG